MTTTIATTARALTIAIAATLGLNAADAAVSSSSNDSSATDTPRTYVVRFADLDLAKVEGAAALYARFRHAASVVCEPLESRDLALSEQRQACIDSAIANAVVSVNRPLVSQYHQSRTRTARAGLVQVTNAK